MKRSFVKFSMSLYLTSFLALSGISAHAGEMESSLARGGKIYDKWYKVADMDAPKTSHPSYPADKKYAKKPKSNWRCKECHGWDYKGKDGAYSAGKHHSGIAGVNGAKGKSVTDIVAVLKADSHGYGGKMSDADMKDVALFVSKGQIDMYPYIDRATKTPKGDKAKGAAYYNTICAGCHGKDGLKPKEMKPFGAQMGNPWEVMHKILNGQPGEAMPALRAIDRQVVVDIMSHMTTLPKKR